MPETQQLPVLLIRVIFNFTGFFQPVDNPPVMNQMNAGRAVPIKFRLNGNQGLAIFAAGYPKSQTNSMYQPGPDRQRRANDHCRFKFAQLRSSRQNIYNYVWKTERSWQGTCRQFSSAIH